MPKVSIIVPIYNVENEIERCARSLLEQTLIDIEFIFVNDCTPDKSMEILSRVINDYPERRAQIKIINNSSNCGTLATRLSGIRISTGDYFLCCDSDDWMDLDAVEKIYREATKTSADIIGYNYVMEFGNRKIVVDRRSNYTEPKEIVRTHYLTGFEWLWDNMFKNNKEIINKISDIKEHITMWDDVYLCIILFLNSRKIVFLNEALYHYNRTAEYSAMANFSINSTYNCISVVKALQSHLIGLKGFELELNWLKFFSKEDLLDSRGVKEWRDCFPECHPNIMRYKLLPLYNRIEMWSLIHYFNIPFYTIKLIKKILRR
jgi:glycosyltransferase involved in cell wall biosynthesis